MLPTAISLKATAIYPSEVKSFPDRLTFGIGKFTLPQVLPQLSIPFNMLFGLPFDHERVAMNIWTVDRAITNKKPSCR